MNYIIFDLEFNQDHSSLQNFELQNNHYPFEIIQVGAVKLDSKLNTLASFNHYVKPTFYEQISPFISTLTGIHMEHLVSHDTFPMVYQNFIDFIGNDDSVFVVWGMSDIKELFKNAKYHKIDSSKLTRHFINIQPFVSSHFQLPKKQLLRLEHAVSLLEIPLAHPFHNAYYDAYYTGEIFKKVYTQDITPTVYDPSYRPVSPTTPRQTLNTTAFISQFEKMYQRELTPQERDMILLAYRMGKTGQFLE